jgi:hypothetical protein
MTVAANCRGGAIEGQRARSSDAFQRWSAAMSGGQLGFSTCPCRGQKKGTSETAQMQCCTAGFSKGNECLFGSGPAIGGVVSGQNVRGMRRVFVMPLT